MVIQGCSSLKHVPRDSPMMAMTHSHPHRRVCMKGRATYSWEKKKQGSWALLKGLSSLDGLSIGEEGSFRAVSQRTKKTMGYGSGIDTSEVTEKMCR